MQKNFENFGGDNVGYSTKIIMDKQFESLEEL